MSKIFPIVVLLFVCASCKAQLEGLYVHNFGMGSTRIYFDTNGTFTYEMSDCTWNIQEKGNYKIDGNKLTLDIIRDSIDQQNIITHSSKVSQSDSVTMQVNITDIVQLYGIPYAIIQVTSENKFIIGSYSDSDGMAVFKTPKSYHSVELRIYAFPNYKKVIYELVPDKDYVINVQLAQETQKINANNIEFQIKRKDRSYIILKKKKGVKKFIKVVT